MEMTTKRTRFDRRKKLAQPRQAYEFAILPDNEPTPVAPSAPTGHPPTHKSTTAPWRVPRPVSAHVLYRLGVAELDAAKADDEAFDWYMASMMLQYDNDNDLTPPEI